MDQTLTPVIANYLNAIYSQVLFSSSELYGSQALPRLSKEELHKTTLAQNLRTIASASQAVPADVSKQFILKLIHTEVFRWFPWINQQSFSLEQVPHQWWSMPFGYLSLLAYVNATDDQLITISQAAELTGKPIASISQLVSRGNLLSFIDIYENNPRKNTRVLLSHIENVK